MTDDNNEQILTDSDLDELYALQAPPKPDYKAPRSSFWPEVIFCLIVMIFACLFWYEASQ